MFPPESTATLVACCCSYGVWPGTVGAPVPVGIAGAVPLELPEP